MRSPTHTRARDLLPPPDSRLLFDQFRYCGHAPGRGAPGYAEAMQNTIIDRRIMLTAKRHWKQATDYAYWTGMATGMIVGASLGVMVGLVW